MKRIEPYILSKGGVEIGVALGDIKDYILTPDQFKKFMQSIVGRTQRLIDNYYKSPVIYVADLRKFLGI